MVTKKSLVSWYKMCVSKTTDGLIMINLRLWNKAAILKMCWNIEKKQDRLRIKWIRLHQKTKV